MFIALNDHLKVRKTNFFLRDTKNRTFLREGNGEEKGKAEGAKAEKRQIARQILVDKEPLEKIKKWTGLTHQWLGRLKSELEQE